MDGNLNIDDLNQSKTKLQSTLNGYTSSFETKQNTITNYSKLVADVSESMENTKKFYISEEEHIDIEEAHSNYVKAEKDFSEADTKHQLLKQKINI